MQGLSLAALTLLPGLTEVITLTLVATPLTPPVLFRPRTAGLNLCCTTEGLMVITAPVWGLEIFISLDNSLPKGLVSALVICGYNFYHENYKIPLQQNAVCAQIFVVRHHVFTTFKQLIS